MRTILKTSLTLLAILALSCSDKSVDSQPSTPQPAEILLAASHPEIYPDGYPTTITATVYDDSAEAVDAGFVIRFETTAAPSMDGADSPSFSYPPSDDSVMHAVDIETNASGQAIVDLYSGALSGLVRIKASYSDGNHVSTEQDLIRITSAPVGSIVLSSQYDQLAPHGQGSLVYAEILDIDNDLLGAGYGIRFEITGAPSYEGAESPSFNYAASDDSALHSVDTETNSQGLASAILYPGTSTGEITIKASYIVNENIFDEEMLISVIAIQPSHIELSADDYTLPIEYNSTTVYATLTDEYGNPISDEFDVRFEITDAPLLGASFLYPPSPDSTMSSYDTATDINGVARVELYSGLNAGIVQIKATALIDTSVNAERPLIQIIAGPPYIIEIAVSGYVDTSGEAIITPVSAQVWDQYTNPVEPLTVVHFSLFPDTLAYIEGTGYTGGYVNPDDPTDTIGIRGLVEVLMAHSCYHTFDTVRIIAASGEVVDTSSRVVLPLFDGNIEIDADPGIVFVEPPQGNYAESEITMTLQDGLGCPIHNGIILFSVNVCGGIAPGASYQDTTDTDGHAGTTFRIYYEGIPERQPPLPPACDAEMRAKLRGYPDVEGATSIFCTVSEQRDN